MPSEREWQRPDREAIDLFAERYGVVHGADLTGLTELVQRFSRLPYENLSKILAWHGGECPPCPRSPRRVMREHLDLGTGGTCFSLTELLRQLVLQLGLEASPVMAHMRHGESIHCALQVEVAQRSYLVDPGYLVPEPLPLADGVDGGAPWLVGEARLVRGGTLAGVPAGVPAGGPDLYTMEPDGPRWRYRVAHRRPSPDEFRRAWLHSFQQPGMRSLVVTLRDPAQGRLYLHNHKLRVVGPRGKTSRNVRSVLEQTLAEQFGIDPKVTAGARELIRRLRGGVHGP